MILYTARVLAILAREGSQPRTQLCEPIEQELRAWPWYCDNNRHINNGQYLTLMDYGRTAWVARTRLHKRMLSGELHFVVGGLTITYRRPIDLLEPFRLRTQLVAMDDRWFYVEQVFLRQEGKVAARALLKGMARRGAEALPPQTLVAWVGASTDALPPPPSEEITRWNSASDLQMAWIRAHDAP